MTDHNFNIYIAEHVGIIPAIIFNHFAYWVRTNTAEKQNFHDGRYWTFCTIDGLSKLFTYLSARQIDVAIKKLVDAEILITGNYNKKPFDRTKWYAFSDTALKHPDLSHCFLPFHQNVKCISPKCEIDFTKMSNAFHQNVKPIPNISSNIKAEYKATNNIDANAEIFSLDNSVENTEQINLQTETSNIDSLSTNPSSETPSVSDIPCEKGNATVNRFPKDYDVVTNVLDYLNQKSGFNYRYGKEHSKLVHAVLKAGYSVDDMKSVIDLKAKQWRNDPEKRANLRTSTLFRMSNFEQYVGQVPANAQMDNRDSSIPRKREELRRVRV